MFTTKERIISVLKSLSPVGEVPDRDERLEEMGFDSLKRVELIVALEEEFGMEFDQSDLETEQLERVGDLVDLVSRYQEG